MRQVAVLGGLLAVSLVGSYLTWTAPESTQSEDDTVALYQASLDDLQAVAWITDDLTVRVERKSDASGPYTWVTVTEIKESTFTPASDDASDDADDSGAEADAPVGPETDEEVEGASDDTPEPEVKREEIVTAFLGNDTSDKVWETFAPLYALRKLDASASKAAFGLEEPAGTLEVVRRSGPLELQLGGESYGTKDQYVGFKDAVYLIDTQKLRPLRYGKSRLVQRLVLPVPKNEASALAITLPSGQSSTWTQQNAADVANAYWSAADSPDTANDTATSWAEKFFRLRVQSYEIDADLSTMTEAFSAQVKGPDAAWTIKVLESSNGDFYAQSSFNRAPVMLTKTLAAEAVGDVSLLFDDAEPSGDGDAEGDE